MTKTLKIILFIVAAIICGFLSGYQLTMYYIFNDNQQLSFITWTDAATALLLSMAFGIAGILFLYSTFKTFKSWTQQL